MSDGKGCDGWAGDSRVISGHCRCGGTKPSRCRDSSLDNVISSEGTHTKKGNTHSQIFNRKDLKTPKAGSNRKWTRKNKLLKYKLTIMTQQMSKERRETIQVMNTLGIL